MDSSSATIEPVKAIGPTDRCDSCNAKAFYMVRFETGELFFCRHHFLKYEDALMQKAYDIYDDLDFINE